METFNVNNYLELVLNCNNRESREQRAGSPPCVLSGLQRAVTAADDSRVRAQLWPGPGGVNISRDARTYHGDMSLSSDSDASNSSIPSSDARFGSHTVAPDSPTPYTDAIKVNIHRDSL